MIIDNSVEINRKGLMAMLFSRLFLFAFFQGVIALLSSSWVESEKYWLLAATLTNIVSISLLTRLCKQEGVSYLSLFRFGKKQRKKDLVLFLGIALISVPLVLVPSLIISKWFWGNTTYYQQVLFRPIPMYMVYFLLIAFPVTMALAELATYFGYIMPRLKKSLQSKWLALLLPVFFLSIQHCTLPLVFETKFIFFRGLMYLPLALMLGIVLYKRPSLLPYLAILHGLLDAMAATMCFFRPKNHDKTTGQAKYLMTVYGKQ